MQITALQRQTIDQQISDFAQRASIGIVQVQVTITEGEDGNVFLNLFHQPADAPEKYSMLATQLTPMSLEPWANEDDLCDCVEIGRDEFGNYDVNEAGCPLHG